VSLMLKRYAIAIFCPPLVGVRPRRAEEHTDVFRAPYAGYPFACRWARRGKNKNARASGYSGFWNRSGFGTLPPRAGPEKPGGNNKRGYAHNLIFK